MMDINDAKAVIKGLQEKPFICSKNAIETDNGYVIKRIPKKYSNADKIRSFSDEELAEFIEQVSIDSMDTFSFGTKCYEEIWEHKETALQWLQSEVEE